MELINDLLNFRKKHRTKSLPPEILDAFLAKGWYRIGQRLFAVDYIFVEQKWVRVIWLRYCLDGFSFGKKQKENLRKNEVFSFDIKPLKLTQEHEALFSLYRKNIKFDGPESASDFLFNHPLEEKKPETIFPSWMIEVRHDQKLIATGVFDRGKETLSGILNFFHPDYSKFSLGKYLMLKKIELAIQLGHKFYYPGYVAAYFPKFDYKYWPGENWAEVYDPLSDAWMALKPRLVEELHLNQHPVFVLKGPRSHEIDLTNGMVFG
jgi:arginyl-tRNA--protein-N-Asp/Glu arginylyltransferase